MMQTRPRKAARQHQQRQRREQREQQREIQERAQRLIAYPPAVRGLRRRTGTSPLVRH